MSTEICFRSTISPALCRKRSYEPGPRRHEQCEELSNQLIGSRSSGHGLPSLVHRFDVDPELVPAIELEVLDTEGVSPAKGDDGLADAGLAGGPVINE